MATVPRSLCRRLTRPMLAALCMAAAGCGADDSSWEGTSDTDQIRAAVERVMEAESVEDQCERGVSERFVREVYVTLARCREANEPDADDDEPDVAKISATRIARDKATTRVTLTSAKGARASGRVALVKVGGIWKVDRLSVEFLRSMLAALPIQADGVEQRRILECIARATRTLPTADVRRIGDQIVGRRFTAQSLPPRSVACIR